jgi:hypothetical protein
MSWYADCAKGIYVTARPATEEPLAKAARRTMNEQHVHTEKCWEPDSGCDMGRNADHAVAVKPSEALSSKTGNDPLAMERELTARLLGEIDWLRREIERLRAALDRAGDATSATCKACAEVCGIVDTALAGLAHDKAQGA